jgi:alanine-glyoxylate transaminase / serine-glyoxylate transaminase / serine-pyruvate transaminase
MLPANANGFFPYTPATNLLYGLAEAIDMLHEEGLDNVFARHQRHSEATRRAVQGWGLEVLCLEPRDFSHSLTAVVMPEGHNADAFRAVVLENFNMSLGNGLSKLAGKVFRIGHLGDFNDLMLMGTICGVEMGLAVAGVPHQAGGAAQAMTHLKHTAHTLRPPGSSLMHRPDSQRPGPPATKCSTGKTTASASSPSTGRRRATP